MGKKKKDLGKPIRKELIADPRTFVQEIAENYPGFEYTRAVDTYIMERVKEAPLKIEVKKDGKVVTSGNLIWISRTEDNDIIMYLDNKKFLYPSADNVAAAFWQPQAKKGGHVEIITSTNLPRCLICGKSIEIFEDPATCPSCGSISHQVHLEEWVRMKGTCSNCNASLKVEDGEILLADNA